MESSSSFLLGAMFMVKTGKTVRGPPVSGGANHPEEHDCHQQAPSSRCECFIFPVGFTIVSSVSDTASGVPLPSSAQTTSLPPSFHCDDIVLDRRSCAELLTLS